MGVSGKIEDILNLVIEGINEFILSMGGEVTKEWEMCSFTVTNAVGLGNMIDAEFIYLFGKVEKEQGGLGLAFRKDVICAMLNLVGNEVGVIDDTAKSYLLELGEALLGGVLCKLSNIGGKGIVQFEEISVPLKNEEMVEILKNYFTKDIGIITLNVPGGLIKGRSIVLLDGGICKWFDIDLTSAGRVESHTGVSITESEVQEFLNKELIDNKGKDLGVMSISNDNVKNLGVILGIEVEVTARLGTVEMPLSTVLSLGPGSVINVGHLVDEPIELFVNNKLIARGDVVIVDEKFGVRITEVVSQEERIESLR